MQQTTAIEVRSCKEMGGAMSVVPVIRGSFYSGLMTSIGRYAVIGCKLQVL